VQLHPDRLPEPPPSLDGERARELTALTADVLARQRAELTTSLELSLRQVPAPLRGIVRRLLGL
jgi:hypothetical protein